nr:hypothetical protein [Fictibacillus enclensis]
MTRIIGSLQRPWLPLLCLPAALDKRILKNGMGTCWPMPPRTLWIMNMAAGTSCSGRENQKYSNTKSRAPKTDYHPASAFYEIIKTL